MTVILFANLYDIKVMSRWSEAEFTVKISPKPKTWYNWCDDKHLEFVSITVQTGQQKITVDETCWSQQNMVFIIEVNLWVTQVNLRVAQVNSDVWQNNSWSSFAVLEKCNVYQKHENISY